MSRYKVASFYRAHEYERDCVPNKIPASKCPSWLDAFARELAAKEKTAVEVARDRKDDIYHQMSSIMGNHVNAPKFSSVEEVVSDYQKRTGLEEYLKKVHSEKNIEDVAKKVLAASEDDTEKKTPEFVDRPELIKRLPAVEAFIFNLIETNYGIQLPAIQQTVASTFGRDGVREEDVDDPEFARYVNKLLIERQSAVDTGEYANLGKGVGTQREFDHNNQNLFHSLMPRRDTY